MRALASLSLLVLPLLLAGCGERATLPVEAGIGPDPTLPPPNKTLFPTVKIASVVVWPEGTAPTPAPGLAVQPFAVDLDHPRWMTVLPNGDVLVAETNAPAREGGGFSIRRFFMRFFMGRAGAGVSSADRITLLRDTDGDGRADVKLPFITGLTSPFGMALVGTQFYVADADALLRFDYPDNALKLEGAAVKVADLPAGRNHHWTKNVIASPDGRLLFVTVGSNSNIGENGMDEEVDRAAILRIDPATGQKSVFASGLRNPNGMAWNRASGQLWTVVNERDEIGSDLVPDYLTSVRPGGFYGWPYSYYGQHVDERVKPQNPALVARAIKPDYALGPHTASLGLTFADGAQLGARFADGAFIGQHGSWNRDPPSGYKVIFVPFANGQPAGKPVDVLTGFLGPDGKARGRPVGVVVDARGGLLVADDVGNRIWRVSAASTAADTAPPVDAAAQRPAPQ